MYLLIPGRHHALTNFQVRYLFRLIHSRLQNETDIKGKKLPEETVDAVVFAVTSANHQKTRRNPIAYRYRQLAIHSLNKELPVPVYSFPVNDTGIRKDFASYTIKTVGHESEGQIEMTRRNTVVICSTPVRQMYADLGYTVLGAECPGDDFGNPRNPLPWEIIERIPKSQNWKVDPFVLSHIYSGTYEIIKQYNLDKTILFAFNDPIAGDDGDLTETRDYTSYIRQMDEIATIKWNDVKSHVRPGRIGDIGCSAGSWLKLATEENKLKESDFFGIELARQLFQTCENRKSQGEFLTPNIWFSQKNAVTGNVFKKGSMNTIHSSSLTHEIESYGSRQDLLDFIKNRFSELQPGGVWINRDVIGPENGDELCLMKLNENDGSNDQWDKEAQGSEKLAQILDNLSTKALFYRFASDFRRSEGYELKFREVVKDDQSFIELKRRDASEFLLTKDYKDNWLSEMHETFCYWSFSEWKKAMEDEGFRLSEQSRVITNDWIVKNRFDGKTKLFDLDGVPLPFPPTNVLLIGEKVL